MAEVKVMGHVPADTDSTISPLVYAWYLTNIKGVGAEAVIGSEVNKETQYVLERFRVSAPRKIDALTEEDKLILLDTNNPQELISGYEKAELIEIIDHHKLFGGLMTDAPIAVTIKPWACVATILWDKFGDDKARIPMEMQKLLLAAIISDTLKLKSPTTTEHDINAVNELATMTGEDVDDLAKGMFAAKSDISDQTAREVILTDAKDFTFGGKSYKISAIETASMEQPLSRIVELQSEAEVLKEENKLAGVFVFIVDIIDGNTVMIATDGEEKELAQKAFDKTFEDGKMSLPGVVSRKKQMVPAFEGLF